MISKGMKKDDADSRKRQSVASPRIEDVIWIESTVNVLRAKDMSRHVNTTLNRVIEDWLKKWTKGNK